MVLCFLVIDVIMLVVFSVIQGASGLSAKRVIDKETPAISEGVSYIWHEKTA